MYKSSEDANTGVAITGLSAANAIVIAFTEALIKAGVLKPQQAAEMVIETVGYIRDATDLSLSIPIADTLCDDLEQFAARICRTTTKAQARD